jgi:multiple sugar transport system substrate-binding protein
MTRYIGLTWNHPRGFRALDESARCWSTAAFQVNWDRQSLEQFESRPITEVCSRYDLVVLDHPHIGEAATANCLVPLEEWCGREDIGRIRKDSIGQVLLSYFYAGRHWALPLDAATQVLAYRADQMPKGHPPSSWHDIVCLAKEVTVVLSLAGPHALLTFYSICVAFGEPPLSRDLNKLVSRETGERVLELMANLFGMMEPAFRDLNPIEILEEMATSNSIVCCPLVYGYVNYAAPQERTRMPVTFRNAPRTGDIGIPGSTLGGTGIAVSRRCNVTPELRSYLLWLVHRFIDFQSVCLIS